MLRLLTAHLRGGTGATCPSSGCASPSLLQTDMCNPFTGKEGAAWGHKGGGVTGLRS
jgi:hypothetical protein